jgi:hypothetical protein
MTTKKQVQLVAFLEKDFLAAKDSGEQDMKDTLLAGLTWQTHGWVDLALDWIEQGFEIDLDIVETLEEITPKKSMPQSTRHKANKFARKWRNANGT